MTTVLLVRHGQTTWNVARRIQGWAPVPLDDRGREQARALARHLAASYDVERIHASDLRRTTETAYLVQSAAFPDAEVTYESAWRERHFGVYQGLGYEALFEGYPEFDVGQSGVAGARAVPDGGESLLEMRDRVLDGWERLVEDAGPDETRLVVTHGGPLYVLLGHLKGWDVVRAVAEQHQENCALNEVWIEEGAATIRRENEAGFLSAVDRS